MFKSQPLENLLITATFALVLFLGIPTYLSLADGVIESSQVSVAVEPVLASRMPASVPKVESKISSVLYKIAKYDLDCSKKAKDPMDVSGEFIQLGGKSCLRDLTASSLEILNNSNGYSAAIFYKGTESYQTDLIQLQKGDNQIVIRYRDREGKTVEELVSVRFK